MGNPSILQDYTRTMSASKLQESGEVRIAHTLHTKEDEFVFERRKTVFQSLQELKIYCSEDTVPNIALLGSGGGQRAMVGLLGSLVQLDKAGLLDCVLYLSGVSGSTWCMASLYQEPDWSTKLETVKDQIIKRLTGPGVRWGNALAKLKKYYYEKDHFSLTDVWAVMVVTEYVKEIDECKLSDQWDQHNKDLFPIYTVIDKQYKQCKDEKDPWFEISPLEAGYSLTGAFVETSSFGSQFDNGSKKKPQDEMDMLYLQALCGSVLADGDEIRKFLWQKIKDFFEHLFHIMQLEMFDEITKDPNASHAENSYQVLMDLVNMNLTVLNGKDPSALDQSIRKTLNEKCYQVLMDLVDMNLAVLNGKDPSALDQSIRKTLNELSGGKHMDFPTEKLNLTDKQAAKLCIKQYTKDMCHNLRSWFSFWPFDVWIRICRCMVQWIWGRKYDFLQNMNDESIPSTLLKSETRDYEDTGLFMNSPYFSVLRKERNIDLIISLDFSDGDPFMEEYTAIADAAQSLISLISRRQQQPEGSGQGGRGQPPRRLQSDGHNTPSTSVGTSQLPTIQNEMQRSFPGYFRREMIRSKKRPAALSKISPAIAIKYVRLQFLLLSSPTDRTPKPSEEIKLLEAGLGKRTMTVADNSCHEEVVKDREN